MSQPAAALTIAPAKAARSAAEANVIFRRWGQKLFNDPVLFAKPYLRAPRFFRACAMKLYAAISVAQIVQ